MVDPLIYGSVCDGMGAAHVIAHKLGWRCAWLAEIDPHASSVTEHHYPDIPNLGDIMAPDFVNRALALGGIDILVGGTPCQSFSIAGLRNGLGDARGNLTLRFVELANAVGHAGTPVETIFWENVPGVLSDKTNAFGCFTSTIVGEDTAIPAPRDGWTNAGMVIGPARKAAWRVLDAQGFVAQRRRRVFVVASRLGGRVDPERVLFETEAEALRNIGDRAYTGPLFRNRKSMCGSVEESECPREVVAAITARGVETCGTDDNQAQAGHLIPIAQSTLGEITHAPSTKPSVTEDGTGRVCPVVNCVDVTPTLRDGGNSTGGHRPPGTDVDTMETLIVRAYRTSPNCGAWDTGDRIDALTTGTDPSSHLILSMAFQERGREGGREVGTSEELAYAITRQQELNILTNQTVRRLTPTECLRLQSFPDDYFDGIKHNGKPLAEGQMYKMIGNSWNTESVGWVFRRINAAWHG